jgi:uncharacterized protein YgbK (DUF1537 family)
MGLPKAYRANTNLSAPTINGFKAPAGREIILAGSCSNATKRQVEVALEAGIPAFRIDPMALASGSLNAQTVLDWIGMQHVDGPILVYSTAPPDAVREAQERLGRTKAGEIVEATLAEVARSLPSRGFTRLIVAGGETSGAVVNALGAKALAIGPEIDPGVPWTRTLSGPDLALALKSGNFGAPNFFLNAYAMLR